MDVINLYSTSLCNLCCKYCFIPKNKALEIVDKKIEESFKDKYYYYNFAKELYGDITDLKGIEIWGGEPTLHMDRVYDTIDVFIQNTKLNNVFFSTNFCTDEIHTVYDNFVKLFSKYNDRKLTLAIQISLDGPWEISDINRGKGVTDKVISNLKILSEKFDDIPDCMNLEFVSKPTVDMNNIRKMMSKDRIIEYYKFFEDYLIEPTKNKKKDIKFYIPTMTLAVPNEFTVEDGKDFAQFCKLCKDLEIENKEKHIFKYYKTLTPYRKLDRSQIQYENGYDYIGGTCGSGINSIMLLPGKKASGCHRHFIDIIEEYRDELNQDTDSKYISFIPEHKHNQLYFRNKYELELHKDKIKQYTNYCTTSSVVTVSTMIRTLAFVGQIEEKYKDAETARRSAIELLRIWNPCISDNIVMTNSITGTYNGMIKLLFNGAIDYILE